MNERTALGLRVFAAAGSLGVLGDAVLRAWPWGPNAALWLATLLAAAWALLRRQRVRLTADGYRLGVLAVWCAAWFAVRDSATLWLLNALAAVTALSLALAAGRTWPGQLRVAALADYVGTVWIAGIHALAGAVPLVFREIAWERLPLGRWSSPALAVGRGLAIALVPLVVFGTLLASADAVFGRLLGDALRWDLGSLGGHLAATAAFAWIAAGLLRGVLHEGESAPPAPLRRGWSLQTVELATALGALDALFLVFVLVQLRYLFGGAAQVTVQTGLTYAEYARRGFFELVAVVALALPLLFAAQSLLRPRDARQERVYRWLAGSMVGLLAVVAASALFRMRLYQAKYGLTELRLYTTAFMGWLVVLLALFAATVLRGRRRRFGFGALLAAFTTVAALDVVNPDALIVHTNAAQAHAARELDTRYAWTLSADAVPSLVDALVAGGGAKRSGTRAFVASRLLAQWTQPPTADWRTWNWSRIRAGQAVTRNAAALRAIAAAG